MDLGERARDFINGTSARWIQWILSGLVIPVLIVGVKVMIDVEVIKSNRFTAADGQHVWQELSRKADRSQVPPEWFKEDVAEIKTMLLKIQQDFNEHLADRNAHQ